MSYQSNEFNSAFNSTTSPGPSSSSPPSSIADTDYDDTIQLGDDPDATIWAKLAAVLWILTLLFWIYVNSKAEEEEAQRLERRRIRREARTKRKKMLEPNTRKAVIANTIISRIIEEDNNDDEDVDADADAKRKLETFTGANTSTSPESECSICLEKLQPYDKLSWSKSLKCHHIFHSECLQPWLMSHDECPCCRTLFFDESDFEKVVSSHSNSKSDHSQNNNSEGNILVATDVDDDHHDQDRYAVERQSRFRVVNGLVSIVRQLSPNSSYDRQDEEDDDDDDEEQPPMLRSLPSLEINGMVSNLSSNSVEMVSMTRRDESRDDDNPCGNDGLKELHHHGHDHNHNHIGNNNKQRRKKKNGGNRYSSITTNTDDEFIDDPSI